MKEFKSKRSGRKKALDGWNKYKYFITEVSGLGSWGSDHKNLVELFKTKLCENFSIFLIYMKSKHFSFNQHVCYKKFHQNRKHTHHTQNKTAVEHRVCENVCPEMKR